MSLARLAGYLFINMAVSAAVAVAVLIYWENYRQPVTNRVPDSSFDGGEYPLGLNAGSSEMSDPTNSSQPAIYRVRSGDTMSSIAIQYEVTVEELMIANKMSDPNSLAIDQLVTIPVKQAAQPTQRPMATSKPASTVIKPRPPDAIATSSLPPVITIRVVSGVGDLAAEQVVIMNVGGTADLGGWTLVHPAGDLYDFPELRLHQTGQLTVHTNAGLDTVTDLYWARDQAVWQSGQVVQLHDADGNLHATYELP